MCQETNAERILGARYAEERGIDECRTIPMMEEWDVGPRVAMATAMKAQEQGIAGLSRTAEQLHAEAATSTEPARESVRALMNEGVIPPVPLIN